MIQFVTWPPPTLWTECIVTWNWILETYRRSPNTIYEWCNQQPSTGLYHVRGIDAEIMPGIDGFIFSFEQPQDATWFRLHWPEQ
jgi:hypothetical protein